MSWFEAKNIASIAKSAIKEAQKSIDKALDIKEEEKIGISIDNKEHESKSINFWESFTGSFFEDEKIEESSESKETIVATQPPRSSSSLSTSFNDHFSLSTPSHSNKATGANISLQCIDASALCEQGKEKILQNELLELDEENPEQLILLNEEKNLIDDLDSDFTKSKLIVKYAINEENFDSDILSKENVSFSQDKVLSQVAENLLENMTESVQPIAEPIDSLNASKAISIRSEKDVSCKLSETITSQPISLSPASAKSCSSISERDKFQTSNESLNIDENSKKSLQLMHSHDGHILSENFKRLILPRGSSSNSPTSVSSFLQENWGNQSILDVSKRKSKSESEKDFSSETQIDFIANASEIRNKISKDTDSKRLKTDSQSEKEILDDDIDHNRCRIEIINEDNKDKYVDIKEVQEKTKFRFSKNDGNKQEIMDDKNFNFTSLEISSRSESSTETMAASTDSSMNWSDLTTDLKLDSLCSDVKNVENFEKTIPITNSGFKEQCLSTGNIENVQSGSVELKSFTSNINNRTQNVIEESTETLQNVDKDCYKISKIVSQNCCEENVVIEPEQKEQSPISPEQLRKNASSEHSSADETTSSDIEVISSPSMEGSVNGGSNTNSRLWSSAHKTLTSFIHDKVDSLPTTSFFVNPFAPATSKNHAETVPSSMTTSFTSLSESESDNHCNLFRGSNQLAESQNFGFYLVSEDVKFDKKGHKRSKSQYSENCESDKQNSEIETLNMKLAHLSGLLERREAKIVELSHLNNSLNESNMKINSRLSEFEKNGSLSPENVKEEFTQRLVNMERKFQQALKDKETVQKQFDDLKSESASLAQLSEIKLEMREKDALINELRMEGEKLSKQQLNYSSLIKKLRSKEKEYEANDEKSREQIESLSLELDCLKKQTKAKNDVEKSQIDAIRQLTLTKENLEKTVTILTAENSEVEGKLEVLKQAHENAYKEMSEIQTKLSLKEEELKKIYLSSSIASQQQVEAAIFEAKKEKDQEIDAFIVKINQLKDFISKEEYQSKRRERKLKDEISDLQQRLSDAEQRTCEISNSVGEATRPILRQMENLQRSHKIQQENWEKLEESLTKRLQDSENSSLLSAKKDRDSKQELNSLQRKLSATHSQLATSQTEINRLKNELEKSNKSCNEVTNNLEEASKELIALKSSLSSEMFELKLEKETLEQQLEVEKTANLAEKRRSSVFSEQIKEKDKKIAQLQVYYNFNECQRFNLTGEKSLGIYGTNTSDESRNLSHVSAQNSRSQRTSVSSTLIGETRLSSPRSSPTPSLSKLSFGGSLNESLAPSIWQDDAFDSNSLPMSGYLYNNLRANNTTTIDALTSALRQREGELHQLQSEIIRCESQKESLSQELINASNECESTNEKLKYFEVLEKSHADLDKKYNALLQLYGESVEKIQEMELDLVDVKEMYRMQIDQLLKK